MKYNALKEVTVWDMDFQPNHTYFLNEAGKMVAYIKKGTSEIIYSKKPQSFSKSYRKFEKVYIPEYKEQA
jgi:hypothetical protein